MGDIHRKSLNCEIESTYNGLLGRMVNILETSASLSANRMSSDDRHLDDSYTLRSSSTSDTSRFSLSGHRKIVSEFKNYPNGKSSGMPVKMLIAQEMSNEVDSRGSQPNLVAKLMGLDALPGVEHDLPERRSYSRSHRSSVSCGDQQSRFVDPVNPNAFKDAYDTWKLSKNQSCRGKHEETESGKRMALVREKFSEAKRLSMDGKLRQSKQFQDALEVLSSNKDLFLKCLQEPDSVFSEHLNGWLSIPPPPDTRRITVLLPSKVAENYSSPVAANKDDKQEKKDAIFNRNSLEKIYPGSSSAGFKYCENSTQPTRIVVLKPSPGKLNSAKAVCAPQCETSRELWGKALSGGLEDGRDQGCREDAKATRYHMHSNLGRLNRDENLGSSVFFNGHASNDGSFLPDDTRRGPEVMSAVARHSWDCVNTLGSPYSSPSHSQPSYSPDTSGCRKAKKRHSERWVPTSTDGICQEQRHALRSTKSLGEMLALSEAKMAAAPGEDIGFTEVVEDLKACSLQQLRREEDVDELRNLVRSKSVPILSPKIETSLDIGISDVHKGIPSSSEEDSKAKATKLSFRGLVSGLFSIKNKRLSAEKTFASESKGDASSVPEDHQNTTGSCIRKPHDQALTSKEEASFSALIGNMSPEQCGQSVAKAVTSGFPNENQDQPSPVSVLDPHFGEERIARGVQQYMKSNLPGAKLSLNFRGSNAIGKSPAIGTIPRTLAWDEVYADTASSNPAGECLATRRSDEEPEWVVFAKALLSVSGLQDEVPSNMCPGKWFSHESPLDPLLRDKYIDLKDKEMIHEAKRRRSRSTRKLVFDCVNAALVHTAGWGETIPCNSELDNDVASSFTLVDKVWSLLNSWFSDEALRISDNGEEDNNNKNTTVDAVVKDEVVGWKWGNEFTTEINDVKKDIAGTLLEDLVCEAVTDLAGRVQIQN